MECRVEEGVKRKAECWGEEKDRVEEGDGVKSKMEGCGGEGMVARPSSLRKSISRELIKGCGME